MHLFLNLTCLVVLTNAGIGVALPLTAWIIDRYTGAEETDRVASLIKVWDEGVEDSKSVSVNTLKKHVVKNTRPSLPLSDYVGRYTNDLVGEMKISVKGKRLFFELSGDITGELNHLHFDTFLIDITSPPGLFTRAFNDGVMQFSLNIDGTIKVLMTGGITYERIVTN